MNQYLFPALVAHRGGGAYAPENTLSAFRVARSYGFRAAECDVKLSADKIPILLHDDGLLRTGGQNLLAANTESSHLTLADVSIGYPDFLGSCVPFLSEIIRYCYEYGIALNIEIKPSTGEDEETAEVVADMVARQWPDASLPLVFSSFSITSLKKLQYNFPDIPRAWLTDTWESDAKVIETITELGCVSLNVDDTLLSPERIAAVAAQDCAVCAWTVNDMGRAAQLFSWGVRSVITDNLSAAIKQFPDQF